MDQFYNALWLFFCYSFFGWLGETAQAAVRQRRYVDRGLLFGPVCITYGVAGMFISGVLRDLSGNLFFLFLGSAIYATVVEWISGLCVEKLTHTRWWDYSQRRWNLDGRICLGASLLWGVLGVAAVKWVGPSLIRTAQLLPGTLFHILLWAMVGVAAVDALATGLTLAGVLYRMPKVRRWSGRLAAVTVRMGEWILKTTERRLRRAYPKAEFYGNKREKSQVFAPGCGFCKLFWIFMIAAFLGDVVETLFCRVTMGRWMSRSSVVWGPFSIVWGLALALATLLLHRYRDRSDGFIFMVGTLVGGGYEYLCSVFTERVFGVVFWDYSDIPFNLDGRVNLLYCFFWGIASVVWTRAVYPRLSKLIERVPIRWGRVLTAALAVFMTADILVSAMALGRQAARARDIPPRNAWEEYLDGHFDDARLNQIYPAANRTAEGNLSFAKEIP